MGSLGALVASGTLTRHARSGILFLMPLLPTVPTFKVAPGLFAAETAKLSP
jgi:hypothetical protein